MEVIKMGRRKRREFLKEFDKREGKERGKEVRGRG